jgi:uncharacterized membrane protein
VATKATKASDATTRAASDLQPGDQLKDALRKLTGTAAERAVSSLSQQVTQTTGRLNDYAGGGDGSLMGAALGAGASEVTGKVKDSVKDKAGDLLGSALPGGGNRGDKLKVTNIVEQIDVGVPLHVAYDQWTRFTDFPTFMKKVENVSQDSDEKLTWKAQVFWSHRTWESTIVDQVPDERIVWQSEGEKGHVDGAVTFHELSPQLTRIIVVLEYHPQGFLEKTGNLWRAQGRRVRLELKHFQRHVMTQSVLHPPEGWGGEIRDGEVVEADDREAEEAAETDEPEGAGDAESAAEKPDEPEDEDKPRRGSRTRGGRTGAKRGGNA